MFHWSNTLLSVHYNGNWHIDQQNCVNYALKSSHHIHIWQSADAKENMYSPSSWQVVAGRPILPGDCQRPLANGDFSLKQSPTTLYSCDWGLSYHMSLSNLRKAIAITDDLDKPVNFGHISVLALSEQTNMEWQCVCYSYRSVEVALAVHGNVEPCLGALDGHYPEPHRNQVELHCKTQRGRSDVRAIILSLKRSQCFLVA